MLQRIACPLHVYVGAGCFMHQQTTPAEEITGRIRKKVFGYFGDLLRVTFFWVGYAQTGIQATARQVCKE